MEEELKNTLQGLRQSSKGKLKYVDKLHGLTHLKKMEIMDEYNALPPWSPEILKWLARREDQDSVCDEMKMDNSCDGFYESVERASVLEIPDEDLSAVGDLSREITEYERCLDDQLQMQVIIYIENFKKQFWRKLESGVQMTRDAFSKEAEEKHRKLKQEQEKQLVMERYSSQVLGQWKQKTLEKYRMEEEMVKAMIHSGEQQNKKIHQLMKEREKKLYDQCRAEYQGLMNELHACWSSCSHPQYLPESIVNEYQKNMKVLQGHWNDPASMRDEKQHQERLREIHLFLMHIKAVVQEANHIGLEQEKIRRAKEKEEQEDRETERKQVQAVDVPEPNTKASTKAEQPETLTLTAASAKKQEAEDDSLASNMIILRSALPQYMELQLCLSDTCSRNTLSSSQDPNIKKYRFVLQKAVGITFSGLSTNNGEVLIGKITQLKNLLCGRTVVIMGKEVSTAKHPDATLYCFNLLAMRLVKQGEDEVSINSIAAFPLAALAICLHSNFPEMGKLILAHMYTRCPILVPVYFKEGTGMTQLEHLRLQGYKISSEGAVETEDDFVRRTCGVVRLFAAVISSPQLPTEQAPHPHGLRHGWVWLARVLNMEPYPNLTAAALVNFLEIAGHALLRKFGKQFRKLLFFLCKEYVPKLQKCTTSSQQGALQRLTQFLDDCVSSGKIPEPKGYLSARFWRTKNEGVTFA